MIQWLMKIFRKEEEEPAYPPEFAIVTYNNTALRNGIEDDSNKIIIRYKYNEILKKIDIYSVYGYSESLLQNLKTKLKIPIHDKTEKKIILPVFEEINLDEVSYKKG